MAASKVEFRLCVEWLVRCKILPEDHPSTREEAELFDLARALRDGVLMCHLLNELSPNSIDLADLNMTGRSKFLSLKRIRTFLYVCRQVFGLTEKDLFGPLDLFDMINSEQVIDTLSKLSKCPLAVSSGIQGFPPDYGTIGRRDDDNDNHDEIHRDLEGKLHFKQSDDMPDEVDGGNEARTHTGSNVQQTYRPSSGMPVRVANRFDFALKELVETEKNYVDYLNKMVTDFVQPLRNVVTQVDHDYIFKNFKKLCQIHTDFYGKLNLACTEGPVSLIADSFIDFKKKFLLYGDYCYNLARAQDHLEDLCRKDSLIAKSIKECEMKRFDGRFRLRDLLNVPLQRVHKYYVLLKELIKHSDSHSGNRGSGNRVTLEKGMEAMEDVSLYLNEVKRDTEQLHLINEVQNCISGFEMPENTSLKDYGRLFKNSELKVKSQEDKSPKKRYIFLFNKVMLICKLKGELYIFKSVLKLSEYTLHETSTANTKNWSHQFLLVSCNGNTTYSFFIKTADLLTGWIDAISIALDSIHPEGHKQDKHEFVMHTFPEPTDCDVCKKLLRGVFYQGYKCQVTGLSVHKDCITKVTDSETSHRSHGSNSSSYDLIDLQQYPWFAGELNREDSNTKLENKPNGTFLIRISARSNEYVLSVKFGNVKHMKVQQSQNKSYFLKEHKFFNTIPELVAYFQKETLKNSIPEMNTTLGTPYKFYRERAAAPETSVLGQAVASFNYTPVTPDQLPLKKGDLIKIISKSCGYKGWWKGELNGKIGYFHYAYVEEC